MEPILKEKKWDLGLAWLLKETKEIKHQFEEFKESVKKESIEE